LLETTNTALITSDGEYLFSGLPAGNYVIKVIAPDGVVSTTDLHSNTPADVDDPDTNIDNNDNGVGESDGTVTANQLTMQAGEVAPNITLDQSAGATIDLTVDFGFKTVYALGNRVWYDTNNSARMDNGEGLNGATKVGVDGVTLELYAASDLTAALNTTTTTNGGYYLFDSLEADDYIVVIPANQFASGGALEGYWSSGTTMLASGTRQEIAATGLTDDDADTDDNGTLQGAAADFPGAVVSVITTLGPTATEQTDESDLDGGSQGNPPDNQANMTVDFGFYAISLGDLVWEDSDNSGAVDVGETGIDTVAVQLWSGDGSTLLDSDVTVGGGLYSFTGLPAGDYILRIPDTQFQGAGRLRDYYSSTGNGTPAPAPDTLTTNSDDNGDEVGTLGFSNGYVQTSVFSLTPAGEDSFNNDTGLTNEPRIDFGVYKNPHYNLSITKDDADGNAHYLQGGSIQYEIIITNNGPADVNGATVTDNFPATITAASWTCVGTGTASCTASGSGDINDTVNIPYGEKITYSVTATVAIDATGDITNTASVEAPDGTIKSDDHTDKLSALSVAKSDPFTVVAPGSEITYTITVTNEGDVDLTDLTVTDTLPADVTFVSASPAPVDDTASPLVWNHANLVLPGDPTVLASGESASITLTVKVKDNDEIDSTVGSIINSVHVEDAAGAEDDDSDEDALARDNTKTMLGTNHEDTTTPAVTIGELLTYRIQIEIPAGQTLDNLTATDILDSGLAFDECLSITSTSLTSTLDSGDPTDLSSACPLGGDATNPDPSVSNNGHKVVFSFGDVTNTDVDNPQMLVLDYYVVVLDNAGNTNGVGDINNIVTWSWTGGELIGEADPVEIVEPDMDIEKTSTATTALLGSIVPFSIEIYHTDDSTANAYDVVVTDTLPAALEYVAGSISGGNPIPYDSFNYDAATRTITLVWDYFPLMNGAARAHTTITFDTIFVGPAPVTNEANIAWTSLPIDPSDPGYVQSEYNEDSTERWYDPTDNTGIDNYVRSSSIRIDIPHLPATGFAPSRVTLLPKQPAAKAYDALGTSWIEIPKLGVQLPIVGVPLRTEGWDLTWLDDQAGYLEGTAFPGLAGNTAITAHVYLADGSPGPFVSLSNLNWGDKVILHANGERYTYQIRETRKLWPNDLSVLRHEDYDWITLLTCQGYNEKLDSYEFRYAVRAVLIEVQPE